MNENNNDKLEPQDEDSSEMEESSSIVRHPAVESKIEEIIEEVPAEKKERIRHSIQELFVAFMERSSTPQITPEVAKILAESADKDNENKFKFLIQKQKDSAEIEKKELTFRETKHRDRFSLVKPIVYFVLFLVLCCTAVGIWLCYIGKETLGAAVLTGIWGAVFGYLAGIGTSDFFKDEKP